MHLWARGWAVAKYGVLLVLVLACAAAILRSADDVRTFVGVDLVPKIGGAQRLFGHVSPYTEWTADQTRFLTDALAGPPVSRCTYPPTLLLLYRVGAYGDYRVVRYAWAAAEWLSLLASIGILVTAASTSLERWLTAAVGIVLFACSFFWRVHVERGQYYVFVTLLWALAWATSKRRGVNTIGTGLLLGAAAAIRPTTIVVLLPLAIFRFWRSLAAAIAATLALVVATLPLGGVRAWIDYQAIVRFFTRWTIHLTTYVASKADPNLVGYDQTRYLEARTTNTSAVGVLMGVLKGHVSVGEPLWIASQVIIVTLLALALWWTVRVRAIASERAMLLSVMVLALACDFAAPVRFGYADILYLAPVAVAMPGLLASFRLPGIVRLSGPLVLGSLCVPLVVQYQVVATLSRSVGVMVGLGILLVCHRRQSGEQVI
jgi:hypothetical protein